MAAPTRPVLLAITIISCLLGLSVKTEAAPYLGKFLGKLSELHHGVSGEVYAVDARTLHIKDFTYDGQGPAAYFFAGNTRAPGNTGFRIRDENGSGDVLKRYRKEDVTITLPEGKTLSGIKWFSVWCEEFEVNFGDVKIPKHFDYPRPQKVEALRGVHGVSSDNIVIVDAQTLLVPNLSYDGEAPDAKFWVGRGSKPSPQGIRVPDENGKEIPLRKYDRKTVVLTLPGDLTVFDIGHFGIWCEAFTVDFGHVQIPQTVNVPPSLKMLGVSPQSKLNCEVLQDDLAFEVRWAVAGDSIVLQLVAKLENREYMSFGISGDDKNSVMVGGDVVVAWVDKETLKGYAEDYFLDAKSQCSGPKGSCPDTKIADNTNNIRLLNAAMVNGYSIVTYQRPLKPSDQFDRQILTNRTQPIIWAIGPLNQRNEVSFHSQYNKKTQVIDFGRPAKWNCPMPEGDQPSMKPVTARPAIKDAYVAEDKIEEIEETPKATTSRTRNNERRRGGSAASISRQEVKDKDSEKSASRTRTTERRGSERRGVVARPVPTPAPVTNRNAWDIPAIQCHEPEDGVFYAQMGPTGGKRGYPAITGHVGWGISWYINGLLIPVINVVRGKTYTFVVEGGFDPETPAKYHPFYITDDSIGGYEYKTNEEKKNVRIFAGARQSKDGDVHPTGVGRLCHWTHQGDSDADDFDSFGAYQRTLELKCDQGEPGVIQWTPDKDTPDTVYYQCFTHRYLGWKINVVDSCDHQAAASEIKEIIAEVDMATDLADSPSLRIETRVKANDIELVLNKDEVQMDDILDKQSYEVEEIKEPEIAPEMAFTQELPKVDYDYTFKTHEEIKKENHTLIHHRPQQPGRLVLRRPIGMQMRPPFMAKPYMRPNHIHRNSQPMTYKKPYYRPLVKMPMRPMSHHHMMKYENKPQIMQSRPQNMVYMKPSMYNKPKIVVIPAESKFIPEYTTKYIPDYTSKIIPEYTTKLIPDYTTKYMHAPKPMNTFPEHEMKVEISPQQPSTERELNAATEKLVQLEPTKKYETYESMQPAINTGFNPASVVIESGFKPIMSKDVQSRIKEIESRMTENESPEIEFESELGVIDESKPNQYFAPMFIPSPTIDSEMKKAQMKRNKPKKSIQFVLKQSRSIEDDEITAANERVESYYLPPDNNRSKPVERPRQRSNIDVPPGTVVTYDGRKVSGVSLTPRAGDQRAAVFEGRSSKASELIRSSPQFVPFKGELPPLIPQFVNYNAPQLQSRGSNRQFNTNASTKLKLVSQLDAEDEDVSKTRTRRDAHHTEEHTAEQEKEKEDKQKNSSNNVQITFYTLISSLLIHYLLKL